MIRFLTSLRRIDMNTFIITESVCLSQIRTTLLYHRCILNVPRLLTSIRLKLGCRAHISNTWCPHRSSLSLLVHVSLFWNVTIVYSWNGKLLTNRFHPIQPGKPRRQDSSFPDRIIDKALFWALIYSSLSSAQDVPRICSRNFATTDKEYTYRKSFVPTNALFEPYYSATHSIGRKATKLCPICTSHYLYMSLKFIRTAWTG